MGALQVANVVHTLCGLHTTRHLSTVHRLLLDQLRSAVVWAFGLCVHYLWDRTSRVGEPWTHYSYLQMGGYALIIVGQLIYNDLLVLPCSKDHVFNVEDYTCIRTSTPAA